MMSHICIRGAALLACLLLVLAAGMAPAIAIFSGFTSMFTAFGVPTFSHAQPAALGSSDFLWNSLGLISDSGGKDVAALKGGLQLGYTTPLKSSGPYWSSSPLLAPGEDWGKNPGMASYKNFLGRYGNASANIYEN